jgi:hypothetical protein
MLRSSPSHRTLRISLPETVGCSLLWNWAPRGHVSVVSAPSHTSPSHHSLRISLPVAGRDSGFCTEPHTTQPPHSPDLAYSGRQGQWFLHRATHHPATTLSGSRSHWQAGTVVSAPSHISPSHRTHRISLPMTSGCSLLWNWASRGLIFQPWGASNGTRRPSSGRFQQKPSAKASSSGRIHEASVCVQGPYCEGD